MPAGRPVKFTNAEDMQAAVDEYFNKCEEEGDIVTVSGLAYHLGMATETLRLYGQKDEFFATVKRAKQRVEIFLETRLYGTSPTGAIFNLKNNFGWKDKTTTEHEGGIEIGSRSIEDIDAELRARLGSAPE